MLRVLVLKLKAFKNDLENRDAYSCLWHILVDLKYMARQDCLNYCINQTDFLERIITIGEVFYFIDPKAARTTMIYNMHDGQCCAHALELEFLYEKVANLYMLGIDSANVEKNRNIMKAFLDTFILIDEQLKAKGHIDEGFITMPVHRCFAFYLTRLLINNQFDPNMAYLQYSIGDKMSVQQVFRHIFKDNLPKFPEVTKDDDYSSLA